MSGHKYIGNIPYTKQMTADGLKALLLDVGVPDEQRWPGPHPVVVIIHGGTWIGRRMQEDLPWHFVDEYGFALVRFDYRTAYEAPFPAQVADCRSAVRFIRKHAAEYNIDPNRIGVRGCSAGGHLAAMLGVSNGAEGIDNPGDDLAVSPAVQAIIDNFGPTNILELWRLLDKFDRCIQVSYSERQRLREELYRTPGVERHFIRVILDKINWVAWIPGIHAITYIKWSNNLIDIARKLSGKDSKRVLKNEDALRRASPIEYLTGALRKDGRMVPPFRVLHGEEDYMVPFSESKKFVEELRKIGADVEFDSDCGGGGHFPSAEHWWKVINPKEMAFFKRALCANEQEEVDCKV